MDFSRVELSAECAAFQRELRDFLAGLVAGEMLCRDHGTGEKFDETVYLALGAAGYPLAGVR